MNWLFLFVSCGLKSEITRDQERRRQGEWEVFPKGLSNLGKRSDGVLYLVFLTERHYELSIGSVSVQRFEIKWSDTCVSIANLFTFIWRTHFQKLRDFYPIWVPAPYCFLVLAQTNPPSFFNLRVPCVLVHTNDTPPKYLFTWVRLGRLFGSRGSIWI